MPHAGASDFDAASVEGLRIKRMVSDEQYQSIPSVNHPFSDAAVAQAALRELAP